MVEFAYVEWPVMLSRLLMAAAAGAIVGIERERRDHPAGFRTLLLVSAGSCLFTLVSIAVAGEDYDPGRVAAGIITGIGFLGAGTIIRHGGTVQGLTTAASIWAVAAIGMAAGIGWWEAVVIGTALMFVSLTLLKWLELKAFRPTRPALLRIELDAGRLLPSALRTQFTAEGLELAAFEVTYDDDAETYIVSAGVEHLPQERADELAQTLAKREGVRSVKVT
jgi:putative Mg2+ transporter-C (MgtC) family protein